MRSQSYLLASFLAAAVLLAGCGTTGTTSPGLLATAPLPPPPKPLCPPEAVAVIPDEPLPPAGISTKALADALATLGPVGDDLMRWMGVDHPAWGRQLATRLVKVQGYCKKVEAGEPAPPT